MIGRKNPLRLWLALLMSVILVLGAVLPALGAPRTRPSAAARPDDISGAQAEYVPGEVIVKFKETAIQGKSTMVTAAEFALGKAALGLQKAEVLPHGAALFRTTTDVPQAVAALKRDPRVEYAQPNFIYRVAVEPPALDDLLWDESMWDDPLWDEQWGMKDPVYGVDAVAAWDYTAGDEDIIVALLDTGVDYNHPDLAGRVIKDFAGSNFIPDPGNPGNNPMDDNGHGTHVAGIIAANAKNGAGIAGVAPEVQILAVKAFDNTGSGNTASIVAGIDYAVGRGAQVVNMSFGREG